MIVTTHQPIFLPWPGLLHKALRADALVLLDAVQFPLGRGWMTRNRLKSEQGELWLRVPVHKKGRGAQSIAQVELFAASDWRRAHVQGIRQQYAHAPWTQDFFNGLQRIYAGGQPRLLDFNLDCIRFLFASLGIDTPILLQSELGIDGKGSDLLLSVCRSLQADTYVTLSPVEKYLDAEAFRRSGVSLRFAHFRPPVYPQLWGAFRYNVSALDLLLNCGPDKGRALIEQAS